MFCQSFILTSLLALPSSFAAAVPSENSTSACVNSPSTRSCWSEGFDISTDWYESVPDTGVTREYWFNIENGTASPDGVEIPVMTINGSLPGPTIIADWGDWVVVHVINALQNNGTSIHFHGIRQNWTNYNDGVPSVTQCPIAPGDSFTYKWRATQYGSSWYHSHFYVQAWDGVFGGILINGPATANYDVDLGNLLLTDWYHDTADNLALQASISGPPTAANGLINGTNVYNETGSRFETTFEAGKRYRLRLVNTGADNHMRFMIDNHTLEVISTDFVPIVPYNTTNLSIGLGQRYDVIVQAKEQTSGNFWLRAIPQESCSDNDSADNIKGIIRYGNSTDDPTTSAYDYQDSCSDEEMTKLVPYLSMSAADSWDVEEYQDAGVQVTENALLWTMGGYSFHSEWDYPTVQQALEGNDTWTEKQRVFQLPEVDKWVYMAISSVFAADHPIHLHGHDFWILDQGFGTWNNDTSNFVLENAPRRDVAMLPASGHLVIAFKTDNPGAWLLHCHIAWHTSEGLAVQFLEREDEMVSTAGVLDSDAINGTCANWNSYANKVEIDQFDSGV
ncbi:laccase [Diaporthe sp. PMI_573]|nr:laccase [Diaporthaceae sp. PMI_573]